MTTEPEICPISREEIKNRATLACGHVFELFNIHQVENHCCPVCRKKFFYIDIDVEELKVNMEEFDTLDLYFFPFDKAKLTVIDSLESLEGYVKGQKMIIELYEANRELFIAEWMKTHDTHPDVVNQDLNRRVRIVERCIKQGNTQ